MKSVSLAGAHSRGSMAHQSTHRRRDGVARFIKAQQQKRQLVRSSGPRAAHTPTSSSAHTQTAGRGRRHRRRPTKDAAAPAGRARALARQRAPMRQHISISIIIIIIRINNPHQHHHQNQHPHQQQTRWRGASYPASFDSTGHPNKLCGREPLTQFHSTLLGTHRRKGTTTSVETEGKRHAVKGRAAEGGGPQLAHCTGIFC